MKEVKGVKRYKLPGIRKVMGCNAQQKSRVDSSIIILFGDRW